MFAITSLVPLTLVLMMQLINSNADMTPGSLDSDASTLEGYHGMLAQERRLARIVITEAHRTPRTAVFNTIRHAGEGLRQLPAANVPIHERVYNLTKRTHDFIE